MRKLVRPVVAVTVAVALILAMSSIAGATTISNAKYAKSLCGAISQTVKTVSKLKPSASTDPAAYQAETLAAVDKVLAALRAAQIKLKKLSPEDGGKKVTKLFSKYLGDWQAGIRKARDKFAAADPASPAFSAAGPVLGAELQASEATLGDPFSKLSGNQDLLGAFGDEKSCEKIVTVYGG